jgi:hypothetical protein
MVTISSTILSFLLGSSIQVGFYTTLITTAGLAASINGSAAMI